MTTLTADLIRSEPDEVRVRALGAREALARGLDPADLAPIRSGRPTAALSARREVQIAVFDVLHERGFTYDQIAQTFGHHPVALRQTMSPGRRKN